MNYPTVSQLKPPIYKIAVTGGPCAGKTSSLKAITKHFTQLGFRVFSVPQVPTMVVEAGGMILMSKFNTVERVQFQSYLINYQIYTQEYFQKLAQMSKMPAIILCDRGTVDPAAYVSTQQFQAIMGLQRFTWANLRDHRYDRVIFLSSAANGAEKYYSLANNVARHESVEQARALDKRTLNAWIGHPYISVVPNVQGETFDDKLNRAIYAVEETVGMKLKDVMMKKLLIDNDFDWKKNKPADLVIGEEIVVQTILKTNDPRIKKQQIRKRGSDNTFHYDHKQTMITEDANAIQDIRRFITALQYLTLIQSRRDPQYNSVTHKRVNFIYDNQTFCIDFHGNDQILYFKASRSGKVNLPSWIKIKEDVSKNPQYSILTYAKKKSEVNTTTKAETTTGETDAKMI